MRRANCRYRLHRRAIQCCVGVVSHCRRRLGEPGREVLGVPPAQVAARRRASRAHNIASIRAGDSASRCSLVIGMYQGLLDQRQQQIGDLLAACSSAPATTAAIDSRVALPRNTDSRASSSFSAVAEQAVAPVDQRVQGLLPRQCRAAAAGEQTEALIESAGELLYGQNLQPRHGQLDRQRNSVEPLADRSDRRGIVVGQGEFVPERARPLDEQPYRRDIRARSRRSSAALASGAGNDGTRMTLSPAIASRSWLDARIDRARAAAHQGLHDARGLGDDMLAIVDDQQQLLALERGRQGVDRGARSAQPDSRERRR